LFEELEYHIFGWEVLPALAMDVRIGLGIAFESGLPLEVRFSSWLSTKDLS
jgi:hypothetical protein